MVKDKKTIPSRELPLGFVDRQEKELLIRDFVISNIKEVMIKYGFQYLETPSFEYSDSIGKFLPDKDRPDAGVFSFKDENKWLSLRYDLTAPLARYVAKNYLEIPKPFKRYQLGTVWRNEKPGPGRFREFLQFDADFIGTRSPIADAELCVLVSEILEKCGLEKKDYIIKISNRKLIDGVIDEVLKVKSINRKKIILRALDKINRLGWKEVQKLLGKGRKDASGDFTEGAGLDESQIKALKGWMDLDLKSQKIIEETKKTKDSFENLARSSDIKLWREGYSELIEVLRVLDSFEQKNWELDPTIVRGLDYYTSLVFEVELLFEVRNKKNEPFKIGSIGGGGRYDDLVKRFDDTLDCPATGISIGLDRLVYALMQKQSKNIKNQSPVIICNFDQKDINKYAGFVRLLRMSNINSEIYSGTGLLKAQMKYADRRKAPAVILYGPDEKKSGLITIKNLKAGKEASQKIKARDDWKSGESAQIKVKIEKLVDEIKKLL